MGIVKTAFYVPKRTFWASFFWKISLIFKSFPELWEKNFGLWCQNCILRVQRNTLFGFFSRSLKLYKFFEFEWKFLTSVLDFFTITNNFNKLSITEIQLKTFVQHNTTNAPHIINAARNLTNVRGSWCSQNWETSWEKLLHIQLMIFFPYEGQ